MTKDFVTIFCNLNLDNQNQSGRKTDKDKDC